MRLATHPSHILLRCMSPFVEKAAVAADLLDRLCLTDAVQKSRKLSSSPNLAKDGVCLPSLLQASVGRVRSSVVALTRRGPSHRRTRHAPAVLKNLVHLPEKPFFDSIDPFRKSIVHRGNRGRAIIAPPPRIPSSHSRPGQDCSSSAGDRIACI
jgi:hypothetical protein